MNTEQLGAADGHIERSSSIIVLTHEDPDGDAICSALAMRLALLANKKSVRVICNDPIKSAYMFLPGAEHFLSMSDQSDFLAANESRNSALGNADLIITLDLTRPSQLGNIYSTYPSLLDGVPVVNFDHHVSNAMFGSVNIVAEDSSSTAEVLCEFFKHSHYNLDRDIATCLLMGIMADTSRFTTSNVKGHTFSNVALLVDAGADLMKINEQLTPADSVEKARLWAHILSDLKSACNDQLVWVVVRQDQGMQDMKSVERGTSNLSSYLRGLIGVKCGVVLYEHGDRKVRVSLRGRPSINVLSVASRFGGAGHVEAAGCLLEDTTLEKAEELIIGQVMQLLE